MTMEIVKTEAKGTKTMREMAKGTKTMREMAKGEVCYFEENDQYVLHVSHMGQSVILILNSYDGANSYQHDCDNTVRELYPNESITIKFS